MKKVILRIEGMSCSACSLGLEKYLNKQKGVQSASVNLVLGHALIEYEDSLTVMDLEQMVKDAGFESLGIYDEKGAETREDKKKFYLFVFGSLALLVLYISMSHMLQFPSLPFLDRKKYPENYAISLFILTIPFLIYGFDILKSGVKNIVYKTPNMDTLVTVGVISSFLYSIFSLIMILTKNVAYVENLYFESCCMILFFMKLGRYIDGRSKEKTKEAIQSLVQITPVVALLKTESGEKEVTVDEVKPGDILIVKPGMKIAADGFVLCGSTHIEEAFLTGESIPSKKKVGDKVIAGSINLDGYIEYRAEKIGRNSTISEIVRLVVEATNTKAPISKLADTVSGYFVPSIMIIAILTFLGYICLSFPFSESFLAFVTVLVVACPCALGLATPLAIVVSEGLCAKNGILVKNSETLENAHKIDTVIFDKTGTLTYGNLRISKVWNFSNYQENEIMEKVLALEVKVTHPIAKAFIDYGKDHKIILKEVTNFENLLGIGVKGVIDSKTIYIGNNKLLEQLGIVNPYEKEEVTLSSSGNSIVYVIEDNKIISLIGVKDIVRENASKVITKLKNLGKEVIMLTGDNEKTAHRIASDIGIKNVIANVMPSEKVQVIKECLGKEKKVMMIGDGINDAPSLATASIGVSVNSATDIAADSSDVLLLNDNLEKIISLMDISKKTIQNIQQNLFWAFFYNACMIPVAIGFLKPIHIFMNPMMAGFAMTISSLTVVFNSLRLKSWREK